MKTHEIKKNNGSIRMHNQVQTKSSINKNESIPQHGSASHLKAVTNNLEQQKRPSIEIEECDKILHQTTNERILDDLKFIDTTSYSETPSLSNLQNVQASIECVNLHSSCSLSPTLGENITASEGSIVIPTTIISLENEHAHKKQLNTINGKSTASVVRTKISHDIGVDSAVEESTISLEQVMMLFGIKY